MISKEVTIVNKLGMHARAAAKFVSLASSFSCEIELERGNRKVNGKSIMGVMMLAASMNSQVILYADGSDEHEAIDQLENLIQDRFGEDQ